MLREPLESHKEEDMTDIHKAPLLLPNILRERAGLNWDTALCILERDFDLEVSQGHSKGGDQYCSEVQTQQMCRAITLRD